MFNQRGLGTFGEKLAAEHLTGLGYKILDTNFRCQEGEIDIVTQKGNEVVFVEVRTRSGTQFGTPEESVTAAKKEKLIAAANVYLQAHPDLPCSWRIDLVAIEISRRGKVKRLEVIENAIS